MRAATDIGPFRSKAHIERFIAFANQRIVLRASCLTRRKCIDEVRLKMLMSTGSMLTIDDDDDIEKKIRPGLRFASSGSGLL